MQKLESNLAAMQQCTDNRMRKFDAQQRVTEAQIHGAGARMGTGQPEQVVTGL
jgi:hypothetical protein